MSRYEPTRNKKSTRSTFIIPILISFFVGAGGILYVFDNYRNKAQKAKEIESEASKQVALSEKFPVELKTETEADLTLAAPANAELKPVANTETTAKSPAEQDSALRQEPLPDLLSSDQTVRQAAIRLSPGLSAWINTDQVIRKFVLIANDFSQDQRVNKHMSFLRLQDPFFAEQIGNDLFIAPKNYQRYKPFAMAIQAIDAKKAAALYRRFRPLMLQVFRELGYPKDITLESIIQKAASEVIAAPLIKEPIMLIRPSVYYRFADPKLEALNPVHKQMIRMGFENTRIIQDKCREILVEIGKIELK